MAINIDEDIAYIREVAKNTRALLDITMQWSFDYYAVVNGTALLADENTPNARMFHCKASCAPYGHFHYCVDKG